MSIDRATLQRTISEVASSTQRAAALLGRRTQIIMDSNEASSQVSSTALDLQPRKDRNRRQNTARRQSHLEDL